MKLRPGSGRFRVYTKLQESGPEAALKFGLSEGLSGNSLRKWLKEWGSPTPQGKAAVQKVRAARAEAYKAENAPDAPNAPKKPTAPDARGRKRVFLTYEPTAHGTVIEEGPQVSTIRFDNGTERHVPNQFWHELKRENKK